MAKTTGTILAIGGISWANAVILNDRPMDWRIPVATGLAAGMFALAEKAWPEGATAIATVALVTVLFVRVDKNTKAPVETLLEWTKT
jgi:hypothetical protein